MGTKEERAGKISIKVPFQTKQERVNDKKK